MTRPSPIGDNVRSIIAQTLSCYFFSFSIFPFRRRSTVARVAAWFIRRGKKGDVGRGEGRKVVRSGGFLVRISRKRAEWKGQLSEILSRRQWNRRFHRRGLRCPASEIVCCRGSSCKLGQKRLLNTVSYLTLEFPLLSFREINPTFQFASSGNRAIRFTSGIFIHGWKEQSRHQLRKKYIGIFSRVSLYGSKNFILLILFVFERNRFNTTREIQ